MTVAVVEYNAGNVRSVVCALRRLGVEAAVTADASVLQSADKVIFPGVGHAGAAMEHLVRAGLDQLLAGLRQPVLGICLGLQLLCRYSEEGETKGLGLVDAEVRKFRSVPKVPHMGWNSIARLHGPLFKGIASGSFVYFVHSYYAGVSKDTSAVAEYGNTFSAAFSFANFHAVQFHPEKSGLIGAAILKNFLEL